MTTTKEGSDSSDGEAGNCSGAHTRSEERRVGGNAHLREDGSFFLREDGSRLLRENDNRMKGE